MREESQRFHKNILRLESQKEVERICKFIQDQLQFLKRKGAVVGISGGIDSALCVELCVEALGKEKVLGIILPEKESNPLSREYALKQAQKLGIKTETVDITPVLEALGTYQKRDRAVREAFPEYNSRYRSKISLPSDLLSRDAFNFFTLTVVDDKGKEKSKRLKKDVLKRIIAATNTKQRTRMIHLYYFAEKMNYLLCGTTNKSEVIQGYFVKYGDGGVDIEPISHLYKTQVYQLCEYTGIREEILKRTPSPDTYSYEVSDEEFYFRIPYPKLDLLLYAWENNVSSQRAGEVMNLDEEQVRRAFRDFTAKHDATRHLRMMPPSMES